MILLSPLSSPFFQYCWLVAAAAFLLLPSSALASEPCLAQVSLAPARAIVGQQVLYRGRILRRADVSRVQCDTPSVKAGQPIRTVCLEFQPQFKEKS